MHIVLILSFFWFCCLIKFLLSINACLTYLHDTETKPPWKRIYDYFSILILKYNIFFHIKLCICRHFPGLDQIKIKNGWRHKESALLQFFQPMSSSADMAAQRSKNCFFSEKIFFFEILKYVLKIWVVMSGLL